MKLSFKNTIPLLIGAGVAFIVYLAVGWWGFLFLGFWIGGWITAGNLLASRKKGLGRDIGRRISILVICLTSSRPAAISPMTWVWSSTCRCRA